MKVSEQLEVALDIVLDLETFGVGSQSAVVSIGAVSLSGSEFYAVIADPSGNVEVGSVKWWLTQAEDVRALDGPTADECEVLDRFGQWIYDLRAAHPDKRLRLWGSEDFDTVILAAAYRRNGMEPPWAYYESRGLRTAFDLMGVDEDAIPWAGTEHIAIECARHAATALRAIPEIKAMEARLARLEAEAADLVELADAAMLDANRDGGEYDRDRELAPIRAALAPEHPQEERNDGN